jgi:hypothetical protein
MRQPVGQGAKTCRNLEPPFIFLAFSNLRIRNQMSDDRSQTTEKEFTTEYHGSGDFLFVLLFEKKILCKSV